MSARTCYLVTRNTSPYTERTLFLGVFSKRSFAVGARRLYIQYAKTVDTHADQGYMTVDLEKDVVVTPYVIPDCGDTFPNTALVCVYEADCMGQVSVHIEGVFASTAGVAKYYASNPPNTYFNHAEYMVPCVTDSLTKEPDDYGTYAHFLRFCDKCHSIPPLWAGKKFVPTRPRIGRRRRGVTTDDDEGLYFESTLQPPFLTHKLLDQSVEMQVYNMARVQPRAWCEWRCATCAPREFVDVCVSFVATLHKVGRHEDAVQLTLDLAEYVTAK